MFLNQVLLRGLVANEIELKKAEAGTIYVDISLVTEERAYSKKMKSEYKSRTLHVIKCFGVTAEAAKELFKKDDLVCVSGSLHCDVWEDGHGSRQSMYYIKPFNNSLENIASVQKSIYNDPFVLSF